MHHDFTILFIVHTDASQEGLGAALYQEQEGKTKIVSLASRTLTPAEKNYFMHSGKLEFLALKWAVTDKFQDYLINDPDFEVVTDNNPLTYAPLDWVTLDCGTCKLQILNTLSERQETCGCRLSLEECLR